MADQLLSAVPAGQAFALSKAEQFEDEKRRVIASCFCKVDSDGSLLESYITHCRVIEDGAYPADPPPLDSPAENKKMRVVLVAVRKSGRVRMHKARENANGSFSIGKTWNLDDLQEIRNFTAPHDKGFTVSIIKPYYWQANSSKEKVFFITSMVKIYKKYTGGKIPRLEGFEKHELDALVGPGTAQLMAQEHQEDPARDSSMRRPKTPTSGLQSSSSSFSLQHPIPRNITTTPSFDSLNPGPVNRQPSPRQASPRVKVDVLATPMRSSKSVDVLISGRTPNNIPSSTQPPPVLMSGQKGHSPLSISPGLPNAPRRPSSDRTAGHAVLPGGSSSRIDSHLEDADRLWRSPSKDNISASPQDVQPYEDLGQYKHSSRNGSREPETSSVSIANQRSTLEPQIPKKKSTRDVASQFRVAAGAYVAATVLSPPKGRLKTLISNPNIRTSPESVPLNESEWAPEIPSLAIQFEDKVVNQLNGEGSSAHIEQLSMKDSPSQEILQGDKSRTVFPSNALTSPTSQTMMWDPSKRGEGRLPSSPENGSNRITSIPLAPPKALRRLSLRSRSSSEIHNPVSRFMISASAPGHGSPTESLSAAVTDFVADQLESSDIQENLALELALAQQSKQWSRSQSPSSKLRKWGAPNVTFKCLDGLDTSVLSVNLEAVLEELKWDGRDKVETLEASLKNELSQVESSNVIIGTDEDNRVHELSGLLDDAIQGCEEIDSLLTLYAVELSSLNDDITHIENQSQGLQVQAANQKTLQKELQGLLQTVSISPQQMEVLKHGSFESSKGIESIEKTLVALYKALETIDPQSCSELSSSKLGRRSSWSDDGIGSMRALQERRDGYCLGSRAFITRLHNFLQTKFHAELIEVARRNKAFDMGRGEKPSLAGHDYAYHSLWRFVALMAYTKDMASDEFLEQQRLYERAAKALFAEEFRTIFQMWRRITKRQNQDDTDLVFTTQEKLGTEEGLLPSGTTRKLTVKKSLARIRPRGESMSSPVTKDGNKDNSEGLYAAHESFSCALSQIYAFVVKEQNFNVKFFHLSSAGVISFLEIVGQGPDLRRLPDLGGVHAAEPDKVKAKVVYNIMNELFPFLLQELQAFVEWATASDPVQGVGIMYAIEQKLRVLDETDQEWLLQTLQKLHERLNGLFSKFLDEQVRAIDETKVKHKKRKGVVSFIRVFPLFSSRVEEQLTDAQPHTEPTMIREMVNEGYEKLNRAMFESLQAIAKDSPVIVTAAAGSQNGTMDPEDKEQLNYHITMIENMHHYLEEVEAHNNCILEIFRQKAKKELEEHLGLYIAAVVRRPLGKLLDFIDNIELLQRSQTSPTDILSRSSHSKHVFKKILSNHDGKEIRKGIESLKKRVEKHFGEGDDPTLAQRLVDRVLASLQEEYIQTHKRCQLLTMTVYKEQGLEMEFMVQDVVVAFRK